MTGEHRRSKYRPIQAKQERRNRKGGITIGGSVWGKRWDMGPNGGERVEGT